MMLKLSGKLPVFLANLMMMKGGREGGVREANGRAVVGASKQASTHFPRNIHQLLFIFSLSLSSSVHLPTVPLQCSCFYLPALDLPLITFTFFPLLISNRI